MFTFYLRTLISGNLDGRDTVFPDVPRIVYGDHLWNDRVRFADQTV